ncbi:conserved Plasmodium protein, unknown function [Plasmodium ovale]|uniref:Ribosomal protein L7Ae/L30e/S12e/Gadd45 domain-containing protein n=1 Tax=Plasmodium ovale TaxID=36330 RepID=A0A1C3KQV1_PLAOA|nr:conserved Plasmodium protein, unknown function [Plasmodium ovale]
MEERGKIKTKQIVESPYNVELKTLDHDKTTILLKALQEVINADQSMENLIFMHDDIVDSLERGEVRAIILIRTIQYEKFYKHVPIISSLKKVHFVLIEKKYLDSVTFNAVRDKSFVGIKMVQKKDDEIAPVYALLENLVSLVNSYYEPIDIPYLFSHPHYVSTKFKVEKVQGKPYPKNMSRKERKKVRKALRKGNI